MLDKIMLTSNNEVTLIYTNRSPVTIRSSEGNAYQLYLWLVTPSHLDLKDFSIALNNEDTAIIEVPNAA